MIVGCCKALQVLDAGIAAAAAGRLASPLGVPGSLVAELTGIAYESDADRLRGTLDLLKVGPGTPGSTEDARIGFELSRTAPSR